MHSVDLRHYIQHCSDQLNRLRQNWLLNESAFLSFVKDRGIHVKGVVPGEPGGFHHCGWLPSDGPAYDGAPLFHPFRLYSLHKIVTAIAPVRRLNPEAQSVKEFAGIAEAARNANAIVDLAVLLEPIYWEVVAGYTREPVAYTGENGKELRRTYREQILTVIRELDPSAWSNKHEALRVDAAWLDNNHELYLLLRLAPWHQRKELQGAIAGALWIRHIAELIRRAFEEVHGEKWLEEDKAFGTWAAGARKRIYGSERPLDSPLQSRSYLASNFGLLTGSVVRWYVEGYTEYYAITEIVPDAATYGIEIVNLYGAIATGRDNAAFKLADMLALDKDLRRFSMITFDRDVGENGFLSEKCN